jgi:hypothetical protein
MRIKIYEPKYREVDLTFSKHIALPAWVFGNEACNKCDEDFESLNDCSYVIRAIDDQTKNYWTFCYDCWRENSENEN